MVQMAWTFINDSYCTTLCLQWEPEIIAIALMYLTSKLSKLEIKDWIAKKENGKQNWWEQFVEGLELDILDGRAVTCYCHVAMVTASSKFRSI